MLSFARDYDNIPLRANKEYAKKTPFGKLIATGVLFFMSVWVKYLEVDFFGEKFLIVKAFSFCVYSSKWQQLNILFSIGCGCPAQHYSLLIIHQRSGFIIHLKIRSAANE